MGRRGDKSSHLNRAMGYRCPKPAPGTCHEVLTMSVAPLSGSWCRVSVERQRWRLPVPASASARRRLAREQRFIHPAKGVKPRTMPAKAQEPLTPVIDHACGQVPQLLHHRAPAPTLGGMAHRRLRADKTDEPHVAQQVVHQSGPPPHPVVGGTSPRRAAAQCRGQSYTRNGTAHGWHALHTGG